jgi:hypothetical protein
MAATAIVLRHGFPTPADGVAQLAGLALLVINASALGRSRSWYFSGFAFSLAALAGITFVGFLLPSVVLSWSLASAGCLLFLANLYRTWRSLASIATIALLLLGSFLAVHLESFYWGEGQQHNLLFAETIPLGAAHIDVAQQSAVVNMISTYGVASTGIDGVLPLRYHNGAFWVAAGLRQLCGMSALEFIAYGFGILVIPFYVAMFFEFADAMRSLLGTDPERFPAMTWFIGLVVLVGLVPYESNIVRANFNVLILNSDSFMLGLALAFLVGGMIADFCREYRETLEPPAWEKAVVAIALPVLLALVGFVKITLVYSILVLLIWLWMRFRQARSWFITIGLVASGITMLAMMHAETGANKSVVRLFNFDRVPPEWIPYFFLIHFIWAWIFLVAWLRQNRIHTLADLRAAVRAKRSILLELVLVESAAGLVPYLVLYFDSAAWAYFTLCHALLAGAFLMAMQEPISWRHMRQSIADGGLTLSRAFLTVVALIVIGNMAIGTLAWAYRMLKANGEVRAILAGRDPSLWRASLRLNPAINDQKLREHQQVADCLKNLGQKPVSERRTEVLYVPKSDRAYWELRQSDPGVTPFLAPALSGVAMIDGLPEFEDIGYAKIGWGYPQYRLPTHAEGPDDHLEAAVAKAQSLGFRRVIVFDGVSASGCELRKVDVGTGPR